jgi:O-acetylhomoserine/O-acetylserine sulfhydrylase-like pyridoxal-dependent enzyme
MSPLSREQEAAMDSSLAALTKLVADLGLVGLVIYMWWSDNKRIITTNEEHKKDMAAVLTQYNKDMTEQREMYRSNVSLTRDFASIAGDLRNIVSLNIQKLTQVDDAIRGNLFCPMMRIRSKKSVGEIPAGQEDP